MKTKKLLATLLSLMMVALMLLGTMLPAMAALNDINNIKSVALTLNAPKAGATVDLSFSSVTCDAPMDYKVIGLHWYEGNETDYQDDRLDGDAYFVGGQKYTVRIELAVKGDKKWNLDYVVGETDYSHITATVNGQAATVGAHLLNPDEKTICVTYVFDNIPAGEVTPMVSIGQPFAGQTQAQVPVSVINERALLLAPSEYNWYVRSNDQWVYMQPSETFVAGKDYRVTFAIQTNEGFRYRIEGAHTVGESQYIYGYINGKQTSMKVVSDQKVTYGYDFPSCAAMPIDSVSFGGIQAPVMGQNPSYVAPTMGDTTYQIVTDDAITGGAQYGFVNGLAWGQGNGHLASDAVFEQGKYYTLSFFIKSDDEHCFADAITGSADIGYVEVEPVFGDPTLAFVTVEFAPCGGGVMSTVSVGGFREPVHGASPDATVITGQGYEQYGELVWFEVNDAGEREMQPGDPFVYGNRYKLVLVLKATDGFTLAARNALTVNVNGKQADLLAGVANQAESEYVTVVKYFDCAKATLDSVSVEVDKPVEGNRPAQQIISESDANYAVEGFIITDSETGAVLTPDDIYVGARSYTVTVMLTAKTGYRFAEGAIAEINNQTAGMIACSEDQILFTLVLLADELPIWFITFDPNGGDGIMDGIAVKSGTVELPACEFTAPGGQQFLCWSTDGASGTAVGQTMTVDSGAGGSITLYAVWENSNQHTHVYGDAFNDWDDAMHYKTCISPNCPQLGSWETRSNEPGDSMSHHYDYRYANCDATCEDCGYVRTTQNNGDPLHEYTHACSEVCWACGFTRETTHTPGAAASCTEAQHCTVCSKVLANALGHTSGEDANCGHAQICIMCETELAPIQGEHVPGAAATCDDAQKCTVCGNALTPAKGHTAGVEWLQDEDGHWHVCGDCNGECERTAHADADGDKLCDTCGYEISKGLPGWAIALIVIGGVLLLGGGGFCLYWFVIKKKLAAKK